MKLIFIKYKNKKSCHKKDYFAYSSFDESENKLTLIFEYSRYTIDSTINPSDEFDYCKFQEYLSSNKEQDFYIYVKEEEDKYY